MSKDWFKDLDDPRKAQDPDLVAKREALNPVRHDLDMEHRLHLEEVEQTLAARGLLKELKSFEGLSYQESQGYLRYKQILDEKGGKE